MTETFFGDKFPHRPWKSLILKGGGIVTSEIAHVFSALVKKVSIVEMNGKLIPGEETEISDFLKINFQKYMSVFTGHQAISARIENGK